jgi:hypothetical protein
MPFTLAHPAAAVPLAKYRLPLSALVVGSMAPDFPYFIHLSTSHQYGHTLPGILLFCVPAGLVALWLFHTVLKLPLLSLLPASHQARLGPVANTFRFRPSRQFFLIVSALLLGAFTHVAWDSFTHAGGWAVQQIPVLRLPVIQTSRGALSVFKILQHGSTLLGTALLAVWYFRWLKHASEQEVRLPVHLPQHLKTRLICFLLLSAVLCAGIYSYWATSSSGGESGLQPFVRNLVVASVGFLFAELIVFSGIWHLKAARQQTNQ